MPLQVSESQGFSNSVTNVDDRRLPAYAAELAAFHSALSTELGSLVAHLPCMSQAEVLDVGCGDGFYMERFAERLDARGGVTGLDVNKAYLALAQQRFATRGHACATDFVLGSLQELQQQWPNAFDLVWCAQGLYSLAEPETAIHEMAAVVRPGGCVAIMENDTLHQVLLPWPPALEIAIRVAEHKALRQESPRPDRYYIGRRLSETLANEGLERVCCRTQCIDRQAPLDEQLQRFLTSYLSRLAERAGPHLDEGAAEALATVLDPASKHYLLARPHVMFTCVNRLAWGFKSV